jgi:hypothetical protein
VAAGHSVEGDVMRVANLQNGSLVVEVVTTSGRAAGVEFRPGPEGIGIWYDGRCQADLENDDLGRLFSCRGQRLLIRGVELCHVGTGLVAITLADVQTWLLSPAEATALAAFAGLLVPV